MPADGPWRKGTDLTPHPGHIATAAQAAEHFSCAPGTIRSWAHRYQARRWGTVARTVYYDLRDLAIIDREIRHSRPVPATWQDRAALIT